MTAALGCWRREAGSSLYSLQVYARSSRMNSDPTANQERADLLTRFRRNRARSAALFALLSDEAYYSQPIALRHPIVFYEGHLPGFSFNTLVRKALGQRGIDARLEALFARGIDPHESSAAGAAGPGSQWPSRAVVREFAQEADRRVVEVLANEDLDRPGDPLLERKEAVYTILEHEEMHQETLLYMWHRLPFEVKSGPSRYAPTTAGRPPDVEWVRIPEGTATLGVEREAVPFGWDNEHPAFTLKVAPFDIDRHDVTNARYMTFVDAGGYRDARWWAADDWRWVQAERVAHPLFWERDGDAWFWRGMFGRVPLPPSWPVYVSLAEAAAFARWQGARLPSEAEFQRAAYGSSAGERRHPWGDAVPGVTHGVFDFASWDPEPAGSHTDGASAWGVEDLVGNGWEWTSTSFHPFPGFRASPSYPEYSADFFDGEHFVMKGASPATARELLRPTFRNWFRARYPYVYATFRCARSI
jgi:iron(II)-dependent oxidoreductase